MTEIVIDTYGADMGCEVVIDGVISALNEGISFLPVMVGNEQTIADSFNCAKIPKSSYKIIHTDDYITPFENPMSIFGGRDESSMAIAYSYLKENEACSAMLSPGNTGALMIGSICRLGLIPELKLPALASALPSAGDKLICLVDCGANINCSANDLALFAKMGNVFCKCFCGIEKPKVGLMSVGREKGKGTPLIQKAYDKISALELEFAGNLEGSDMVSGYADVIVTDGFSGNLLLKNTEAAGKAALKTIESLDLGDEVMGKIRTAIINQFDFNSRGAATFLGTKKTVLKMHGCANKETVSASINQALRLEKSNFSKRISEEICV